MTVSVFVNDVRKGDLYRSHKRWVWSRPNGGAETFPADTTIRDVRKFVARVCRVSLETVEIKAS